MAKKFDMDVTLKTLEKNYLTADFYIDDSPEVALGIINHAEKLKRTINLSHGVYVPITPDHVMCQFCKTLFRPGNYSINFKPKMKLTQKIHRLLEKKRNAHSTLSKYQLKLIKMFLTSKNRVIYRCNKCSKITVLPGEDRQATERRKTKVKAAECTDTTSVIEPTALSKSAKKKQKRKKKWLEQKSVDFSSLKLLDIPKNMKTASTSITKCDQVTDSVQHEKYQEKVQPEDAKPKETIVQQLLNPTNKPDKIQKVKSKKQKQDQHRILQVMLQDKKKQMSKAEKNPLLQFLSSL